MAPFVVLVGVTTADLAKGADHVFGGNVESGLNGNYGFVGAEVVAFPSRNLDLHGGLGLSATAMGGVGLRTYAESQECFFFKSCDERYFVGVTYSNTLSTKVTTTDGRGEQEFHIPRTHFINVNVGDSTVFFGRLNAMLHLGYKVALTKTEAERVRGAEDSGTKRELDDLLKSGPQISISFGFLL